MFENALFLDNILLPQEFVEHLEMRTGKPIINVLVLSSDDVLLNLCQEHFDIGLIRLVKTLKYGSDLEKIVGELSQRDNLRKSIDAVIFDPEVRESENDSPFSGLDTVLTIEKALNYSNPLPFYCLTTKDETSVKENCGLPQKKKDDLHIFTTAKVEDLKKKIHDNDTGDGRLRRNHIDLFNAAEWFDSMVGKEDREGRETACEFISSVLRDNTDNIINRARSFRDKILDVLVKYNVLPGIGDTGISYGTIVDFIRDGQYPSRQKSGKDSRYYLLEAGHVLPRGLRFMFEDIKENGNTASHTTALLDDYITRSVFYAFCSLLLWLYKNKEEIETGNMQCYGERNPDEFTKWEPIEGTVSVVKVNQDDYYFCDGVHLKTSGSEQIIEGKRVRIKNAWLEKAPKVLNVTFYSNCWEYLEDVKEK